MRIYRNDKFIKRRADIGKYVSLFGIGILLLGLIISFTSVELIGLSFLSLIVGFIASQIGIYYSNRYARVDRPDEVLARALKGFDDRYLLFQYATPAGNVLITPNNCYVFAIKMQSGPIVYRKGKWQHDVGVKRFFRAFAQEGLGNPISEAQVEASALKKYLDKRLPDVEIPIQPVIVFGSEKAEVEAGESPVPAMHAKKLKDWLRGPGKAGKLSEAAQQQLIELFKPTEA
ncbi:MAG: nuclease-related domain-containing protein [Anaerolineae bacterium]